MQHDGVFSFSKQHPSHACLCGIHCSYDQRVIGHYLGKASWLLSCAVGEHLKVREVVMEVRCDSYVILLRMSQAKLHGSKEAGSTGDSCSHEVELPQNSVPLLDAYAFLVS